jgi:hypothetical protein
LAMKEIELFLFLLDNKYPDLQKSEGVYDSFDCISRDSAAYIELKCRHTHYPTLLIEEFKYRKLITQAAERDLTPFYINSTPEGVFSFDLMDVPEPEWVSHWMPATTEFARSQKISKLVGYLALEEAVQL